MADEFPDPDEEFELNHEEDLEALRELEGEFLLEERQLSRPDSSRISQEINKTTQQSSTEISILGNSVDNASANKKRNYEKLLEDVSDLLQEDISVDIFEKPIRKRFRWDQPKDVIKKILDARQLINEHDNEAQVKTRCNEKKKHSISLQVPPWNFVAITRTYDSQRLYVRVKSTNSNVKQSARPIANLLSTTYSQLKAQTTEIIAKKDKLSNRPALDSSSAKHVIDELWVDKYRPRSYLELLSDETVNRQLLHWLKLWDKVVFNRNINKVKRPKLPQIEKKKDVDNDDIVEVDSKGYPLKRIALLSGPPGLGKTTLTHIAARHAGYNVVEINASDERSPESFRQTLLAAMEMKAVMGVDPRPNCLIFDEIDGAPAASIELLLKFVQGKLVPKTKKGKSQPERVSEGCIRPIICICNEPYAPTLRTLRIAAVTIPIPEVSPLRLAERLMEITRKEKLNADFGDLVKMAERSGCDVRSCVGALQYMGSANLNQNLCLSLKDTRKNLFHSWKSILTIPVHRKGVVTISERTQNILKMVQNGEMEKLMQGIFHNYPEVCCDRKLDNVSTSLEWFQFYDLITGFVMHKQTWSLMPYINYGFIAWHLYLARTQKTKLSYPTVFNEVTQKLAKSTGILTAIRKTCGRDAFTLTTDLVGFLPDLLTPKLRTVPSHLYSPKEKADLNKIVNVMLEFGLSFVQEKNPQGGYIYNIDPNILEVGILPNCNAHRYLAYAVQQIISQELEVERLKCASISTKVNTISSENATNSQSENTENIRSKHFSGSGNAKQPEKNILKEVVSFMHLSLMRRERNKALRTFISKSLVPLAFYLVHSACKACKDFFKNIIANGNNVQKQNRISPKSQKGCSVIQNILTKHGIWYKYKEGCNNAVRRNVFMEKLL